MRPGEVFSLRWESIYLNGTSSLVQITEGKTKAARRMLPMLPAVYMALKARHSESGTPNEGWVFPSGSREGHLNKDTAKGQHSKAIDSANVRAKRNQTSQLKPFVPYVLRHTALTRLAQAGADVFTLARIAGHSSITITQRYVHPQADAIERAFAPFSLESETPALQEETAEVGTNSGTVQEEEKSDGLQVVGAKGGTRTLTVLPARS